ncbi:hypothetical protein PAMA_007289 [Pampus argenteus]
MVGFRWIQIYLFLIQVLQFRAVTGQDSSVTVRDGGEVALPCEYVMVDQDKCSSTTWIFSGSGNTAAEELITLGQIGRNVGSKSDRLSVTATCSLVIKKVTGEDVGLYTCRQFKSGEQHGSINQVRLSVITIAERKDDDKVTLHCSVLKYEQSQHTVEWLHEDSFTDLKESKGSCSATVTLAASDLNQKPNYLQLFKCKVTEMNGETLLCNLTPRPSCEKQGNMTKAENESPARKKDPTKLPDWWWLILMVVGLAAFLIIVVAVVRWKKPKGHTTQMENNIVESEDGVFYTSVSYTKKTSRKARVRGGDDYEGGAVTYSTVKASSSSAAASADPSSLYATINSKEAAV